MEGVDGSRFENQKRAAAKATFEFIEIWYNRERLHSSLGYRTLAQMEDLLYQQLLALKLLSFFLLQVQNGSWSGSPYTPN